MPLFSGKKIIKFIRSSGDRTHIIYTDTTCLNVYSHKRCVRTLQWHCWMTQRVKREVWERSLATYTLRTWHTAAATIRCVTTLLIALMSTLIVKWVLLQLFFCVLHFGNLNKRAFHATFWIMVHWTVPWGLCSVVKWATSSLGTVLLYAIFT